MILPKALEDLIAEFMKFPELVERQPRDMRCT